VTVTDRTTQWRRASSLRSGFVCNVLLTRRQLLRYTAMVAATFPVVRMARSEAWTLEGQARGVGAGLAVPMNLDLVTVTDTTAVITWFTGDPTDLDEFNRPTPVEAPGRVLIGTDPNPANWVEVGSHEPTAYHYVEVNGLVAGITYYWRAESAGLIATGYTLDDSFSFSAPPLFTTQLRPPGRYLGTMAWLNDLHFGESVSGLAISNDELPGGGVPPGFAVDPEHPYWRFMAQGAVAESTARGASLMLVNGDLTAEARPEELVECRSLLDTFGTIAQSRSVSPGDDPTYFVTRGNHDRAHTGDVCEPFEDSGTLEDCFGDTFAPSWDAGTTHFSVSLGDGRAAYRFVGLDSNDGSSTGTFHRGELDFLDQELAKGDLTVPLFHHPASDIGSLSQVPPGGSAGLNTDDAAEFRRRLSLRSNVVGVYAGHTHRNNRSVSSETGTVPYFEGGAVKEYPGGYTTVRLYTGGYQVNFWKTSSADARAWSERSRGEYLGLYPYYTLGGLADRNWVYAFEDPSEDSPGVADLPGAGLGTVGANRGADTLAATGGSSPLRAAGVAAAAGGTIWKLGEAARRREDRVGSD
jgi:3',5'-cyclic-AMP phosphodiesterase